MDRKSPENPNFEQNTRMKSKRFIIIGAAGYVAVKHLKAIRAVGEKVVAAIDPNDNLEVLDEYFLECEYFKSVDDAQNFIKNNPVDFITVCSPSYLHAEHIRFALENHCPVICESPLVLTQKEYEEVRLLEEKTGSKIYNVLQYRYSSAIVEWKNSFVPGTDVSVDFKNYSYRGKWFKQSWKGDPAKSGGLLTILGYHFFDALIWIFGKPVKLDIKKESATEVTGVLTLENARVDFELSNQIAEREKKRTLEIFVNGEKIPLNEPDEVLFERNYRDIINKKGFGTGDVEDTIQVVSKPE
jgi:UDP-N-acetyl-2-amino-2-deoxyglucuronate dehydrogenase